MEVMCRMQGRGVVFDEERGFTRLRLEPAARRPRAGCRPHPWSKAQNERCCRRDMGSQGDKGSQSRRCYGCTASA